MRRPPRLPVWPFWQGLAISVLGLVARPLADKLEDTFGGRVCPMQLDHKQSDPFLLLVHHRHAFRKYDPLRSIFSRLVMPEGFPAHPHRGFETITYVLPDRGGLVHRDSTGTKMRYADGSCQWMTAGRGILHEEMWDTSEFEEHELYQIWLNLPPHRKLMEPAVQLLHSEGSLAEVECEGRTPVRKTVIPMTDEDSGRVLIRHLGGGESGAFTQSEVLIQHVTMRDRGAKLDMTLPQDWTCIIYVRDGCIDLGEDRFAHKFELCDLSRQGRLRLTNSNNGVTDFLLLAGKPIGAPVAAQGPMVMNTDAEVGEAMRDYSMGYFGSPWDHSANDDEWKQICNT